LSVIEDKITFRIVKKICFIDINIFVNCNWVDTRWQ